MRDKSTEDQIVAAARYVKLLRKRADIPMEDVLGGAARLSIFSYTYLALTLEEFGYKFNSEKEVFEWEKS
jgi:hypothetical protein